MVFAEQGLRIDGIVQSDDLDQIIIYLHITTIVVIVIVK
jgi:hypothetical protein